MRKELPKIVLFMIVVLTLSAGFLSPESKASPLSADPDSVVVPPLRDISWKQLIPFQPPEKWFSPKGEDDEWYQRRHQQKYRKRR